MGYKLGSAKKRYAVSGRINSPLSFAEQPLSVELGHDTPIYRKKLDGGVLGEANKDGSIFIDKSVKPGSTEERDILSHEAKHLTEMKLGKLKYDDNSITYDGIRYPRKNGKIKYYGKWIPEGSKDFPWEQH